MITHGRQATSRHYLFTWSVPTLSALRLESDTLPSPHFACLLAGDARGSPDALLLAIADHLLERGLAYFCAWGPDCEQVHDLVDQAVVLREVREGRDYPVVTTWHADELLDEALWFLLNVAQPDPTLAQTCQSWVGITVANALWTTQMQQQFNAAAAPSDTP